VDSDPYKDIDIDTLMTYAGWAKHILPSTAESSTLHEVFQTALMVA